MNSSVSRIYSDHYGFDIEQVYEQGNSYVIVENRNNLPVEQIEQIIHEATRLKISVVGEIVWKT